MAELIRWTDNGYGGSCDQALCPARAAQAAIGRLECRWKALRDWLGDKVAHDQSVMEQYRDFGDGGITSRSHGAMASAEKTVLAKMAEPEAGQ